MGKYADGTIVRIDDTVLDADPNGRNFVGRVIDVIELNDLCSIVIASIGVSNNLRERLKLKPSGHISTVLKEFMVESYNLGLAIESAPSTHFVKLYGPLGDIKESPKITKPDTRPQLVGID